MSEYRKHEWIDNSFTCKHCGINRLVLKDNYSESCPINLGRTDSYTLSQDKDVTIAALKAELSNSEAVRRGLEKERDELKKLNLSTICAYCGTFFEADSDGRKVDALQAHMKICPKHPMREIEKERDELRERINKAIEFYSDLGHLRKILEGKSE